MGPMPYAQLPAAYQQWLTQHQNPEKGPEALYQSLAGYNWQWPEHWGQAPQDASMFLGDLAGLSQWGQPTPAAGAQPGPGGVNPNPGPVGANYMGMPAYSLPSWFNPAPWDYQTWQNMTPEQLQANVAFHQTALPWTQMAQNAQQWGQEFGENQKRFWEAQWPWQQKTDQFAMDLAQQQQDFTESSWGQDFGLRTREQDDLVAWRDTQAQLQREQMMTEQENAALAAWGRKFRPNTRYL